MKPILTHIALHVRNFNACLEFYQYFCQLNIVHDRRGENNQIVWLAEDGRETDFIFVLLSNGPGQPQADNDFSHLGFAASSKTAVDEIAEKAKQRSCLVWEPRLEPYPVGYYCGVKDPDGRFVEFSYGQPLGPGSKPI